MRKLRHRLEAAVVSIVGWVAARSSYPGALALGRRIGRLGFAAGLRRRVVLDNLRIAFPDWDRARLRATARATYESWGQALVDEVRSPGLARPGGWQEVLARLDGLENVEAARRLGKGVVLVTGHYGPFELFGAAVAAAGFPVHFIVQPQSNPWIERRLERARRSLGVGVIRRGAETRDALRALRANHCVALLADQDARERGVFIDFLGRASSTPVGPAALSLRTGAPIVMGFLVRGEDGRHVGTILPALEFAPSGDRDADVRALTQRHARVLEEWVRSHPDHWYWLHRRWKTPPPVASRAAGGRVDPASTAAALLLLGAACVLGAGAASARPPREPARGAKERPAVGAPADSARPGARPTTFAGAGSSLLPLAETRVGRVVEDIVGRRRPNGWTLDVVDVFQSGAAPEIVPMALPDFESAADSGGPGPTLSDVRLVADGVERTPSVEPPPATSELPGLGGISGLYTWRLRFESDEEKVVRLGYRLEPSRTERGDELLFHYLNTGTPWRGPSGRVNARFELGDLSSEDLVAEWLRPSRYGVGRSSVTWQLSSEEPEEDLVVALHPFADPVAEFADREAGPLHLDRSQWGEWLGGRTPREWRFWVAFVHARLGETPADSTFRPLIERERWFRARPENKRRKPSRQESALLGALGRRLAAWEMHRLPEDRPAEP